ncbi:MAG TPA: alpha/beta hydrolase [Acidobacteriota bacterium]|nr:alpha/beta hydrolase [Acidobacteriota bacterium]
MIRRIIVALFFLSSFCVLAGSREIVERGTFKLYLNGIEKGKESYKVAVDKKRDTYELFSELIFKYPYQTAKRGYVDLKVYPEYWAVHSTGQFIKYEYRSKAEDFSKTDLVETERSATELIDQEMRIRDVFYQEQQRTDDVMQDRIDLGVNSGYLFPAGKTLRFSQTRMSNTRKKDEALPDNLLLLEPYGFCLYRLLLDRIREGGPRWEFAIAIPQFMRLRPGAVEYEGAVSTFVDGENFILKHYNVLIEERLYTSFWVDSEGVIVQVSVPTEGVVAVRQEYRPKPFEKEDARAHKDTIELKGVVFEEKQVRVESPAGIIGATLTLPKGEGPFPAVLLVQDFQPVDRDGNAPLENIRKANPWKQLAFAFAEKGIATLRYDSRGVGESAGDPAMLTLGGRVSEVRALAALFRNESKVDKARIFFLGQGLGSWTAARAAREEKPAGAVFVAFPMKPVLRIWKEQVSMMQNLEGQQAAYSELEALESALQKGEKEWESFRGLKLYIPVIKELSGLDPAEEIRGLKVPSFFAYPDKDNTILPFHGEILLKESGGSFKPAYLKGVGHALTGVDEKGNQNALIEKGVLGPLFDFILR